MKKLPSVTPNHSIAIRMGMEHDLRRQGSIPADKKFCSTINLVEALCLDSCVSPHDGISSSKKWFQSQLFQVNNFSGYLVDYQVFLSSEKFRENSESSSVGEVNAASTFIQSEEESIKSGTIPREQTSSKYASEDGEDKLHYISNLTLMLSKENNADNSVHSEITLAEMGFKSTEVENWDQITQPQKENLLELLLNMIKNYIKTNVQITIGSTKFNCHMMVLQCYSEFFKELDNEQSVILPENKVTPQAFKMVYEWMLSRKPTVQREGILELFNAAQFLKIKRLVDQCWICIDNDEIFSEDTAFILYSEARRHGEALHGNDIILQLMLSRICKFFLTLVASKDFLELGPEEICALLNSNSIGVNTEIDVLMAAVRWFNHNWEERKIHLKKVISCVRFGLMAPWKLVALRRDLDSVEVNHIINDPEIQKMMDDGLSYATTSYYYGRNPENALNYIQTLNIPEPSEREWIKDDLWEKDFSTSYHTYAKFLEYLRKIREFGKNHWRTLVLADQSPKMVFPEQVPLSRLKRECKVLRLDRKDLFKSEKLNQDKSQILLSGAAANNSLTNDVDCVSDSQQEFTSFMRTSQYQIYIFGGIDPYKTKSSDVFRGRSKNVLSYKPDKGAWSCISNMPGARQHHSAVFCRGRIYVMGGIRLGRNNDKTGVSKEMWSFDITSLEWRTEKRMMYPRRDFGLVGDETGLYVVGGEDSHEMLLASMHFYSFKTSTWQEMEQMTISRSGVAVARKSHEIWVAGGIVGHGCMLSDVVEVYNIETQNWTTVTNLRTAKAFARISFTTENLYIFGGVCHSNGKLYTTASVDKYDENLKQWNKVASMEYARHGHEIAVLGEKVLIVGGVSYTKSVTWNSVECFDTSTGKWLQNVPELPFPLSGVACVAVLLTGSSDKVNSSVVENDA